MSSTAITRFAPSPTGSLHLGNARTALFSYWWARKSGGRFILRIEDTDVERSQVRYQHELLSDLKWLGLNWDEGPDIGGPGAPYREAERGEFYAGLFAQLLAQERLYPCYCTPAELELSRKLQRMASKPPRYAGTCRNLSTGERAQREAQGLKPTLRFAVPAGEVIEFVDTVHGAQRFASEDIGDFIVRREDGTSAFFFCNAVDDSVMGVTQVLRGDDHLTNTPRQLLILDALQLRRPQYGHVGLLMGADGTPLSKRHGSTSVQEFRERGFRPEAILNHLFRLGHTSDVDGWLTPADLPAHFRPEHLGRAPARFDESQLLHWQKEAIHRMSADEVRDWLSRYIPPVPAGIDAAAFVELVRHNVVLPGDALAWAHAVYGELAEPGPEEKRALAAAGTRFFAVAAQAYDAAGGDLKLLTKSIKEGTGYSGAALFMPLRIALTGQAHGPELAQLLKLIPAGLARRRLQSHAQDL
jgi:glutamyl-tRNA synthetase